MNNYQCIFCGKSITENDGKVTSLLITANWETGDEQDQQVFCHLKCLKERCDNPENIYLDEEL